MNPINSRSAPVIPSALPNPCGARVFAAEAALSEVHIALSTRGEMAGALLRAAQALREAGWRPAVRFVDTLLLASPLMAGDTATVRGMTAIRTLFTDALQAFRTALARGNLRELACSPVLFTCQHALSERLAAYAPGFSLTFDEVALAGRMVLPAMLPTPSSSAFATLRTRYEKALLFMLRVPLRAQQGAETENASVQLDAACDELNACLAGLADTHPYNFWRLAAACGRTLCLSAQTDVMRQFYAHCNLALVEYARGQQLAPQPLVRETLALLWRDVALADTMAQHAESIDVLRDCGLTVESRAMDDVLSGAFRSREASETGSSKTDNVKRCDLGALSVNANAHENFLRIADASMAELMGLQRIHAQSGVVAGDAFRAAEAAYRLGSAALTLGLGHVALLAESLGLAWRLTAHARTTLNTTPGTSHVVAPDAAALEQAGSSLQTMLLKVAAGIAQPDATEAMMILGEAVGRVIDRFAAY